MTTLFSPDHAVSVRHAAIFIGGLYAVATGGLGWLIHEMHDVGVDTGIVKAQVVDVNKRLDSLEDRAKSVQSGLEAMRSGEIVMLRERIAKAEQKLDCVTCAPSPLVPVTSLQAAHAR